MPPLPPVPLADWLAFRSREFRDRASAPLDDLTSESADWALQARRRLSALATAPEPPPPAPAPAPPAAVELTPTPAEPPAPALSAPPRTPVVSGLGNALGGLGERVRGGLQDTAAVLGGANREATGALEGAAASVAGVGDWAERARSDLLGLGQDVAARVSPAALAPLPGAAGAAARAGSDLPSHVEQVQDAWPPWPAVGQALDTLGRYTPTGIGPALAEDVLAGTPYRLRDELVPEPVAAGIDARAAANRAELDATLARLAVPGETPEQAAAQGRRWLEAGEALAGAGPGGTAAAAAPVPAGRVAATAGRQLGLPGIPGAPRQRDLVGDVATVTTGLGLANPTSLGANLTGGILRTGVRVARELAGETGHPMDAFVDLAAMGAELMRGLGQGGVLRTFGRQVREGPTERAASLVGPAVGGRDLTRSRNPLAVAGTLGTRVNAATDELIGAINAAGARAVAQRRGEWPGEAAQRAADFATYRLGASSPLADFLGRGAALLGDARNPLPTRVLGGVLYTFAPYVRMPERLLVESLKTVFDPVTQGPRWVQAALRGDRQALREARARLAVSGAVNLLLYNLWAGNVPGWRLTGSAPQDAGERRRREAEGTRWETLETPAGAVPLRFLGDLGQSAALLASTADAVTQAIQRGEDPVTVAKSAGSEMLRWTLSESYLRDLAGFGRDVLEGRGVEALERAGARVASRPLAPLAPATAADPYEREAEGFLPTLQSRVPGLREQLPARVDPSTGGPLARRGSGLSRALGADFGAGQSDVARELARYGVTPRAVRAGDQYAGAAQSAEQARTIQRALGSETGRLVRDVVATEAYRQADDAGKERLLRRALTQAAAEADVRAGAGIARSPKEQAEYEYLAVPQFEGVRGTPDEVRRQNLAIRRARSLRSEYRARYPNDPDRGDGEFFKERRQEYNLAQRPAVPPEELRRRRQQIEARLGVMAP